METNRKNPLSLQPDLSLFDPATKDEKESLVVMRESVGFWRDGFRRLRKNNVAMVSLFVIIMILIFAFILPGVYPYDYKTQIRGNEELAPMEYSASEQALVDSGVFVMPHFFGTDNLGRDLTVRVMMGSRISLLVGVVASLIVMVIGSLYGAISGYFGGRLDQFMMRFVDMIYTVPDLLIIILLAAVLAAPLRRLSDSSPSLAWIGILGESLISIFIIFALLYWVGMARIIRSQILSLKEQEYITAAKALGASHWRIISRHLLKNCIGLIIVTTTLQIPSAIFTETFLSFVGLGVNAPMPSLGSLASSALSGVYSFPERLLIPALMVSLIILSFNLFGDGLRDAFDPKLKK
jgi:oligopeptide transport system permease protein